MRTPSFWYPEHNQTADILPWLLSPLAGIYLAGGWLRKKFARAYRAPVPVICIGNLTAGGTGKTPVALALAARLLARGVKVHFLSRGYGGRLAGPVQIDPRQHNARDVGDEALLLAAAAPAWIARDRKAGAIAACAAGAQLLILDDGHQNPHLVKDLSLVLIDAARGFGNRRIIPAGPLRETMHGGLSRADMVVIVGEGGINPAGEKPYLRAHRRLANPEIIAGKTVCAFCGIGAPQQFFDMLSNAGALLSGAEAFPDHHPFTDQQINALLSRAEKDDAIVVTTEKDWVRLTPAQREKVTAVRMEMTFSDEEKLTALLDAVLKGRA